MIKEIEHYSTHPSDVFLFWCMFYNGYGIFGQHYPIRLNQGNAIMGRIRTLRRRGWGGRPTA